MKSIKLFSVVCILALVAGCKKYDLKTNEVNGEGLGGFTLKSPVNNTSIILNSGTPDAPVVMEWNAATPGLKTQPVYRWIASTRNGLLDQPIIEILADGNGKSTKLTTTQRYLDEILKSRGIPDGVKADLKWTVTADNSSVRIRATDSLNLSLTRFGDGASPFALYGPASSTDVMTINPNSTADSIRFRWQKSVPGKPANPVKYKVQFVKEGNAFATPLFQFNSANNGNDTTLALSYKTMDSALTANGMNQSDIAKLQWTVVATSGTFNQQALYVNQLYILREVKLYLVGGSTAADWSPPNAIRLIEDASRPGIFYMYAMLTTAGGGFKFLSENTDWSTPTQKIYGDADPSGLSGNLLLSGGSNNIVTPSGDGVYRITVDLSNNKYYVQKQFGRMGIVGGGTAADWNPPAVFPAQEMGFVSTNLFLGITSITSNGEYKMLDNNDWPNGSLTYTRDYEDGSNGKLLENGNSNFRWTGATGPVRVIWDVRDVKNMKYLISPATEMRVVGNGLSGVPEWNPGASPSMTYGGKGKWTITLALIGNKEFKFLSGNDWGAFDYEDAGNGRIKWDGSDNFKTPAASGNYTITLDEYTGKYTIN